MANEETGVEGQGHNGASGAGEDRHGDGGLTAEEVRVVEGVARESRGGPCPACGRPITAGQEITTALGDVRRGAVGVTLHARCFAAVGRPGLLELMVAVYRQRQGG